MGLQSTVLEGLFQQGLIAARTLGYYGGSSTPRAGGVINGSIAWGGYDSGRFTDPVHTYDMDTASADYLPLNVTNIVIESSDGATNVSLFDREKFSNLESGDNTFTAKLSTDQFPISLPYQITQNFKKAVSASASDLSDGSLRLNKTFNGTMTFVLSDGFRVTLPHDVLYNVSGNSPIQDRKEKDTSPFYLSLPFLSQVYLMMDYDASVFHLATAIQENQFVVPASFCPHDTPAAFTRPQHGSFSKAGLIGAVVGGVIGGLVLMSVGAVAIYMIKQQRKVDKEEKVQRLKAKEALRVTRIQTNGFEPMEEIAEEEQQKERTPLMRRVRFWEG